MITVPPVWNRRSHAPGRESVAVTMVLRTKIAPDARKARPEPRNMRLGGITNAGPTTGDGGRRPTRCRRACPGVPVLCRRWLCVGQDVTARGARFNGSKRCDCRDQRYDEDTTALDNCYDERHASGLFVWAESKLSLVPLGATYRGREDLRSGNAFFHGYIAIVEVLATPIVYSTSPSGLKRVKTK